MMSDYDRDIEIESDEGDDLNFRESQLDNSQCYSQAEKRAHHNALERKRRDQLKDSFSDLQDKLPALQSDKVASRAQILMKAAEYILFMNQSNSSRQQDIDKSKRENELLESEIRKLEQYREEKIAENITVEFEDFSETQLVGIGTFENPESESPDSENDEAIRHPKKQKKDNQHE